MSNMEVEIKELSFNEQWVLAYLQGETRFISPTAMGRDHAIQTGSSSPNHHSAWASPICKKLLNKGLLERNAKGHYRIKE